MLLVFLFFILLCSIFFFFFFQAEDGIRDLYVTGVQTCALPISNRLVKTMLGGWQTSGIVTLESGLPLNIGVSGKQGGNALPNATNRPNLVGKISYPQTVSTTGQQIIQYLDPSAFALPAIGTFG